MPQTGSIFNPNDSSLRSRILAVKDILMQRKNIQFSLDNFESENKNGRLGSVEEVNEAMVVIEQSFEQATKSLSLQDLKIATETGILSKDSAHELSVAIAKFEIESKRSKANRLTNSKSHNRKQY